MTGFGKTGPKSQHPAYDSVIQAFSGLMELNGLKSTGPLRVGPAVVDYGTGIHAAFAISSGVFGKSGCLLAVSPEPVIAHEINTLLFIFF